MEGFFSPSETVDDEGFEVHEVDTRSRRRRRSPRKPLLAGRLWRKPREPWLWTYEKAPRPAAQRSRKARPEVAYADFASYEDVSFQGQGNLAHSARPYGSRPSHSAPGFVGPHDSVRRSLDGPRREAASRRLDARRRTSSRLS